MPPVLRKVAEANRLLSSGEARTVNEAAEKVGIGRSSYYKFKDSVEEFHNNLPGSMLTIVCEVSDRAGVLSDLLQTIAQCGANILTIHQAIPVDGIAVVDKEKCVSCGKCVKACPKHLIEIVPYKSKYHVRCMSQDKGKAVMDACTAGCIGCTLCTKECHFDAIHMNGNVAQIDYTKCKNCSLCAKKCPKGVIN